MFAENPPDHRGARQVSKCSRSKNEITAKKSTYQFDEVNVRYRLQQTFEHTLFLSRTRLSRRRNDHRNTACDQTNQQTQTKNKSTERLEENPITETRTELPLTSAYEKQRYRRSHGGKPHSQARKPLKTTKHRRSPPRQSRGRKRLQSDEFTIPNDQKREMQRSKQEWEDQGYPLIEADRCKLEEK